MTKLQAISSRVRETVSVLLKGTGKAAVTAGRGFADAMFGWSAKMFSLSYERTIIHKDMHRMDRDDEIISFAFDAISSRALGYEDPTVDAFTVLTQPKIGNGNESELKIVQGLVNDLIDRCQLRPQAWQVIRKFVKFGNEFREVLFERDTDGNPIAVLGLKPLPEHTVWPNKNDRGDRVPGYVQRPENVPAGSNEIKFEEYEMLHFLFGEEDGYIGTPLMVSARKNWKRLNMAEDMTAVARIMRGFAKWVHKIPVGSDWSPEETKAAVDNYKGSMTMRKVFDDDNGSITQESAPETVFTNFYVPDDGSGRGGVEMLDPANAQLQNINDINHFLRRLICGTRVPFRYFPFDGSTPKLSEGGGNAEDKHFACLLMQCQMILKAGYTQLFNIELILHGIDPSKYLYQFRMANINTVDQLKVAQTDAARARTFETMAAQYPDLLDHPDVVLREYTSLSDISAEKLLAAKIEKTKPEKASKVGDNRVQLPGAGSGPEARSKV